MNIYSPFYFDTEYKADITKLSQKALEERIIFINIVIADPRNSKNTIIDLRKYLTRYNKEWERRRHEANNNHD